MRRSRDLQGLIPARQREKWGCPYALTLQYKAVAHLYSLFTMEKLGASQRIFPELA